MTSPPKAVRLAEGPEKQKPIRLGRMRRIPSTCELRLSNLQKAEDIDDVLFDFLSDGADKISVDKFWSIVAVTGILENDPRLSQARQNYRSQRVLQGIPPDDTETDIYIDKEAFKQCINDNISIVGRIFKKDLVIAEFMDFTNKMEKIFEIARHYDEGKPSKNIPQLERMDPKFWAGGVCTIDGQRFTMGDDKQCFTLQTCCKPLNYAVAVTDLGPDRVHHFVGQEPSGRGTSALELDSEKRPHNPLINAGGILTTTLLKPDLDMADRFTAMFEQYKQAAGGTYVEFHNPSYLSSLESSDRDFALGYYLRENKCFPKVSKLQKDLEFYFMLNSIEINVESGSIIAATLANGGICPLTSERVFSGVAVQDTLSLMYSCGLYDHSGQFAFTVGLPAKSGCSGVIMLVVPNLMGVCVWSPAVDNMGNSVRGIAFCRQLVKEFNFHNYDNLKHTAQKDDPRMKKRDVTTKSTFGIVSLLFGAAHGDLSTIRKFAMKGMDMGKADYDGRTALHLAAAEGHLPVVRLLIEQCKVDLEPTDRWNFTPLDDAQRFNKPDVVRYLEARKKMRKSEY